MTYPPPSVAGWGQPQPTPPTPPRRPWYKKKRFLIPIGSIVSLAFIGSFSDEPVTPTARPLVQVVESTIQVPSPTSASTAEADARATAAAAVEATLEARAEIRRRAIAKAEKAKKLKAAKLRKAREKAAAEERRQKEEDANSVYYANCTAVRAAGADPIHTGDPGYSRKLDRDGDGVACE